MKPVAMAKVLSDHNVKTILKKIQSFYIIYNRFHIHMGSIDDEFLFNDVLESLPFTKMDENFFALNLVLRSRRINTNSLQVS